MAHIFSPSCMPSHSFSFICPSVHPSVSPSVHLLKSSIYPSKSSICLSKLMYCAITALDGYPLHSDNIHYIRWQPLYMHYRPLQTILFITSVPTLLTSTFCFWMTFAYARAEPPSHIISSFVTGTSITSACQEAQSDPVVPSL